MQIELFRLCEENNIDLLFYSAPKSMFWSNKILNLNDVDILFKKYSEKNNCFYLGAILPSINIQLGLEDSLDFFDSNHLTQTGVIKYNSYVINELSEFELFKIK